MVFSKSILELGIWTLLSSHLFLTVQSASSHFDSLERSHKTMVEYLRCFCDPRGSDWNKWLQFACFVHNTTPLTMMNYTPYEILFCRKANVPGQLQQQVTPVYNYDDLVHDIKRRWQECQISKSKLSAK
jgi:hypothetical protein